MRAMTIGEVKLLGTVKNLATANSVANYLVNTCCQFTYPVELFTADRDYLMMNLKAMSFISQSKYDFTFQHCPHCNQRISITKTVQDLQLKYSKQCTTNVRINSLNSDVTVYLPYAADKRIELDDKEIENILNYSNILQFYNNDVQKTITSMLNWAADDYARLLTAVEDMYCGIQREIEFECPKCHESFVKMFDMNIQQLLGTVDVTQILRSIINISKHSNYQVHDDMLYVEFEQINQLVAEMAAEEAKTLGSSVETQVLQKG